MYADLHVHSYYSDGTDSPASLIKIAEHAGVKVLSLVDHDTVQGIGEFVVEAKNSDVRAIPGIEISTSNNGMGIHILGYYINPASTTLLAFLASLSRARTKNTKHIFNQLCKMGRLNYSWENVLSHARNKDALYSSDVFAAMKNDGIYKDWSEFPQFYYSYFGEKSEAYLDFDCCTAGEAVEIIVKTGGVPVLAHPKLTGDDQQIAGLVDRGLRGIEVYHPSNDYLDQQRYLGTARHYGLLVTGGSDWHGEMSEWDICIGGCGVGRRAVDKLQEVSACLKGKAERGVWT